MRALSTIRQFAQDNNVPEHLVRQLVQTKVLPGFYRGNRYYVNVPLAMQTISDLSKANVEAMGQ